MKTRIDQIGGARSVGALPLTFLAWLEAAGLKMQLAPYLKRARESDGWFVARDEECEGPMPFADVIRLLLDGAGTVTVLHQTDAETDPLPWRVIPYRSWAPKGLMAIVASGGLWVLALAFVWVVLCLMLPVALRTPAGVAYLVLCLAGAGWYGFAELRRRRATALETSEEIIESEPR